MKSLFTLFILLTGILSTNLMAQAWEYNFGTATGSFNSANSYSAFLPDPSSGSDQVYVGNAGGGFNLVISDNDSELQITASTLQTNGNINKFSVFDITSPTTAFSIGFTVRFECDASDNGVGYFFVGDGNYFTDDVRFTVADLFAGVRWTKTAGNSFLTTAYLNSLGTWSGLGAPWVFNLSTDYYVEIFCNNTGTAIPYTYNGSQSVAAYSWELWRGGTFVGPSVKPSAGLSNDVPIDSYMCLAEGSTSNQLVMVVDSFYYANTILDGPLPVELSSFNAKYVAGSVQLDWRTETEVTNYGFDIERKGKYANDWTKIGFVEGHGNTNSPKNYSFIDKNPSGGQLIQYRLKQIDTDGMYEYSDVVEVLLIADDFTLSQNFPNPFNPVTKIDYKVQTKSFVKLSVYDVLGREVAQLINEEKEAGSYEVEFNAANLTSGTYFYQMRIGDIVRTKKMILLK